MIEIYPKMYCIKIWSITLIWSDKLAIDFHFSTFPFHDKHVLLTDPQYLAYLLCNFFYDYCFTLNKIDYWKSAAIDEGDYWYTIACVVLCQTLYCKHEYLLYYDKFLINLNEWIIIFFLMSIKQLTLLYYLFHVQWWWTSYEHVYRM